MGTVQLVEEIRTHRIPIVGHRTPDKVRKDGSGKSH